MMTNGSTVKVNGKVFQVVLSPPHGPARRAAGGEAMLIKNIRSERWVLIENCGAKVSGIRTVEAL